MFTLPRRLATGLSLSVIAVLLLLGGTACTLIDKVSAPVSLTDGATGPTVFPFLPKAEKNTGGALLLVPDAPIAGNNVDAASLAMARWLADRGIASFVFRSGNSGSTPDAAAAEVTNALNALRSRAAEFKIAPDRLGVAGMGRGAAIAAAAAYTPVATTENAKTATHPAFLALIWGATEIATVPANAPATFLVGSTLTSDNSGAADLWLKLRAARVPVDAHLFAKRDPKPETAFKSSSAVSWPQMLYTWMRFQGYLTDQPRLAIKGMAYVDGQPLPQGHVIFTPIGFVGAGPVVGRVLNFTASIPIGEFSIPANQGPVPGRYKVEVRQNANRWLGNEFSGEFVGGRGGMNPAKAYFGHHRILSPSIGDQRVFNKAHPGDPQEYTVEFKPGDAANSALKIEVFSK